MIIIDSRGDSYSFGNSEPYVKIRFTDKFIQHKIFLNPGLYIGEAYMNGQLVIEEGSIEDFINIITASYHEFLKGHWLLRFFGKTATLFRSFHQLNRKISSKKNVELLWASSREILNIFQAEESNSNIITIAPDILEKIKFLNKNLNKFSLDTVNDFFKDASSAGFNILEKIS